MTTDAPLTGRTIAVSISESPDMSGLGMGDEHLVDAMTEVARQVLSLGGRLAYGGDLRREGFSRLLFELVSRHRPDGGLTAGLTGVTNYLPWPVHMQMDVDTLWELADSLQGTADLVCLRMDGSPMSAGERQKLSPREPTPDEWRDGLTAMRSFVVSKSDARIVLGGRIDKYRGIYPGIAEEVLISLRSKQPIYLFGGFGGCAGDVAKSLSRTVVNRHWAGLDQYGSFDLDSLNNRLELEENAAMLWTPYVDEAIALALRGMLRLWASDL